MKMALTLLWLGAAALAAATETPVTLPKTPADLQRGEKLFQVHCALCHGPKAAAAFFQPNGFGGKLWDAVH